MYISQFLADGIGGDIVSKMNSAQFHLKVDLDMVNLTQNNIVIDT